MNKPLISFTVILLSIGFAFFYVKPEYILVKERSADLATLTDTSKDSVMIETLIGDTDAMLKKIETADLERFDVFLPVVIDPIRFANNMQRIGLANGLILENLMVKGPAKDAQKSAGLNASGQGDAARGVVNTFSLGSKIDQAQEAIFGATVSSTEKNYIATKASFTISSTYEAFGKLLFDMERSLGLINVTSLSFQPIIVTADTKKVKIISSSTPMTYQFTVAIETYSLR